MSKQPGRHVVRQFDPDFKQQVVQEILRGERTQEEILADYQLARKVVWRWKTAYAQCGEAAFAKGAKGRPKGPHAIAGVSEEPKALPTSTQARIAELERLCGRLTLENELLKKVLGRAASSSDRS